MSQCLEPHTSKMATVPISALFNTAENPMRKALTAFTLLLDSKFLTEHVESNKHILIIIYESYIFHVVQFHCYQTKQKVGLTFSLSQVSIIPGSKAQVRFQPPYTDHAP